MNLRQCLSAALIATLLSASFTAQPARAVSTSREIQIGQQEDKQIVEQYTILNDPLLTRWVNDVGGKLWNQTARKDIPYNLKILDVSDVNAFSTLGGYVYVDAGTLDFVQSDDELAGVIGHETGHIERRHGVTYPAKAEALELLLGIASLLTPFAYAGQPAEAGVLAKMSRAQELQADQYGLLLMSRAGYDPDAMVSFMKHLGAAHDEHDDSVDKYLADHPGFSDRVSHLLGYTELDPTKRTNDQLLVQALHDQQTARYSIAAMKFRRILKSNPTDAATLLHLGETQIALGLPHKAESSLTEAAGEGTPGTRSAALQAIRKLRQTEALQPTPHADIARLRLLLNDATARETRTALTLTQRRDPIRDRFKAMTGSLQKIAYEVPDTSGVGAHLNAHTSALLKKINALNRAAIFAFMKSQEALGGIGSAKKNTKSGLIKESADILSELQAPLQFDIIPPQSSSIFPYYPAMLSDLNHVDDDMRGAIDASDATVTLLDVGLRDLDAFFREFKQSHIDLNSGLSKSDDATLQPFMAKAESSLDKASASAARAWQLYNLARSRQLQTRITMLGLDFPHARYDTLRYALQERVQNTGLDYNSMTQEKLTPGDVVSASIIAADTNTTPQAIAQEAKATNRSIIDVADARNMNAFSLEIFLGLIYLDYIDDPLKEADEPPPPAPAITGPSLTERP